MLRSRGRVRVGGTEGVGVGGGVTLAEALSSLEHEISSRAVGSSGRQCREIQQFQRPRFEYFRGSLKKWQRTSILASISDLHKRCA